MFDQYNRNITYLRISVTDLCNLRCIYCMPPEGIPQKNHSDILSYEDIVRIVREAVKMGITKHRLTGGEPLVRRDILSLIRRLGREKGVRELTLTTNGVLLEEVAEDLKKSGLDRINISLDTLDPEKYRKLTRNGNLERVLQGIDAVIDAGFQATKLNMVLIPGTNTDEIEGMKAFCRRKGLQLQRINQYSLSDIKSISRYYPAERPLDCSLCNRIRLTADGKLKPCLFSNLEIPVDMNDIQGSIMRAVLGKPSRGSVCSCRQNWQIGG